MLQHRKLNFLMGLSFGSEGKGNVAAYIGSTIELDVAISNNSPNAGHQFKDEANNNNVETVKMLPVCGIVSKKSLVILGSGSVIDVERLLFEVDRYKLADRLVISPYAVIVDEKCREYEREHLKYIASTFQGTGAAIGLKAMRSPDIRIARDVPELKPWLGDCSDKLLGDEQKKDSVLVEVCQGYGLSVDSPLYPYTTSRIVNIGQSFAYLDVPASMVGNVIGIARSYIIRVGNVEGGYSGNTFPDSKELTWEELSDKLGKNVLEFTTVTKRKRRVFTFSKQLFERAVKRNGVNVLFLTFVDYLSKEEQSAMKDYLTNSLRFDFKEVYFVHGFGDFGTNIERVV